MARSLVKPQVEAGHSIRFGKFQNFNLQMFKHGLSVADMNLEIPYQNNFADV